MASSEEFARLRCQNCRKTMSALEMGEGAAGADMTIDCEHCGFLNSIRGSFSAQRVGGRLQVIFEDMSVSQLLQAQQALQAALRQPDVTVDDVAASVEKASAGFAAWIREFASQHKDVIALVGVLLTAVMLAIALMRGEPPPTTNNYHFDIDVEVEVKRLERGEPVARPPYPRRQPCLCGSGKRYKNCHGRDDARYKDPERPR